MRSQFRPGALASLPELVKDAAGVTALEYAFIGSLVAIAIVAATTLLGTEISGLFNSVLSGL
jgi:pilus assembly protein Flp/PilA